MDRGSGEPLTPAEAKARLRDVAARGGALRWLARHPGGVAAAGFAAGVLAGLSPRVLARFATQIPRGALLRLGLASDRRRSLQLLRRDPGRSTNGP